MNLHIIKGLVVIFCVLLRIVVHAQQDTTMSESDKQELRQLFHSKQVMMASLGYYKSNPSFLQGKLNAGDYESFWYHDSYFLLGLGQQHPSLSSYFTH